MKKVMWWLGISLIAISGDWLGCTLLYAINMVIDCYVNYSFCDWLCVVWFIVLWTGFCAIWYIVGCALSDTNPINWKKYFRTWLWDED